MDFEPLFDTCPLSEAITAEKKVEERPAERSPFVIYTVRGLGPNVKSSEDFME